MKKESLVIAVDFDGTCVVHSFPKVGKDIGAVPVLKRLVSKGHKLILFTMRSDIEKPKSDDPNIHTRGGNYLTDAVNWFNKNDIPLYGIQSNPTQRNWTTSPKAYADIYLDDAALGCPLVYGDFDNEGKGGYFDRPHVDWVEIEYILEKKGIL